jgi:hypothetical protein
MTIAGNLVHHEGNFASLHTVGDHGSMDHTGHTLANISGHTVGAHSGMAHIGHDAGTTAGAATLRHETAGTDGTRWLRSTSVLEIKENIWPVLAMDELPLYITARALSPSPWVNPVLDLIPVGFDSIPDADRGRTNPYIGLIAEQVEEVFPWAATHHQDERGNWVLDGWDHQIVLSALIAKVKEQEARIQLLEAA